MNRQTQPLSDRAATALPRLPKGQRQELYNRVNVTSKHSGRQVIGLVIWIAAVFAVAMVSAQFKPGPWYFELIKPPLTPPNWVFAPVWTLLYLGMAVAAWRVWRTGEGPDRRRALMLFVLQLLVNGFWSYLFFGRHEIGAALVDIAALVLLLAVTATRFWRIDKPASTLLWPYLAWVSFASYLNLGLWLLN